MRGFFGLALLLAIALGFSTQANATVVDVDLNKTGFTEVPFNPGCYCYAFNQVFTQVFQTNPADTYNFGQLTIIPLEVVTPDYSQYTGFLSGAPVANLDVPTGYIPPLPPVGVQYPFSIFYLCSSSDTACIQTNSQSQLYNLVFSGGTSIQLEWTSGDFTYTAPAVPEPSTWAMLLIGFASIGFMTCRRRKGVQHWEMFMKKFSVSTILKQSMLAAAASAGLLYAPSSARAELVYAFSFDVVGHPMSGEIDLPDACSVCASDAVYVDTYPFGPLPPHTLFTPYGGNTFTVQSNTIISSIFAGEFISASSDPPDQHYDFILEINQDQPRNGVAYTADPYIIPPIGGIGIGFIGNTSPITITAVPEPSTWGMLLIGFAAIGFAGYRKSRSLVPRST